MEYAISVLLSGISVGGQYALIAIGYTMVYGILRLINFAHGDVFMVSGLIAIYLTTMGLPLPVTLALAILITVLLGFLIERVAYKPLRSAPRMSVMISAIGVSYLLQNTATFVTGGQPMNYPTIPALSKMVTIGGASTTLVTVVTPVLVIGLVFGLVQLINHTKIGMAMRAVAKDFETSQLMGIKINRVISTTFIIGSALAAWAGHDDEVIQVWQRYSIYMPLPARGVAAVAQARRNQKAWEPALALWKEARSLAPDNDDYRIGYIKTLADARKDGEALSEARRLVAEQASVAHLQTLSYVYLRLGKSWDQLLVDTQILDRDPQNKTALASLMATLTRNRIDSPALGLANSVELTPAEKRNLQLNAAAELVRLADTPSREEKARYALARTALTQYDAMIAAWHPDPQAAPDIIRARIDRLGALYASAEYAQVIREYQSLIAQQQTVPDWAIGWVISSFIALKQIEPALTLIHQHPSWLTSQQNEEHELFYALLDTGQYPEAQRYVARLTRNAPYIRRLYGSPTPQPNDDWLTAQSLNVHYLAATNDLPQAEARMQRLAATAPGNQGLQIDYAALLQERGLPRAAERQLKAAESLEPASLQLERQQAAGKLLAERQAQLPLLQTAGDLRR